MSYSKLLYVCYEELQNASFATIYALIVDYFGYLFWFPQLFYFTHLQQQQYDTIRKNERQTMHNAICEYIRWRLHFVNYSVFFLVLSFSLLHPAWIYIYVLPTHTCIVCTYKLVLCKKDAENMILTRSHNEQKWELQ